MCALSVYHLHLLGSFPPVIFTKFTLHGVLCTLTTHESRARCTAAATALRSAVRGRARGARRGSRGAARGEAVSVDE